MTPVESLVKFLLSNALLSADADLDSMENIGESPIWALSRKGLLNEKDAIDAFETKLGIPYVDLEQSETVASFTIGEYTESINPKICWRSRLIPLKEEDGSVVIAMANPFEREAIETIEFVLSKPTRIVIAEESKIVALLAVHFPQPELEISDSEEDDLVKIVGTDAIQNLDSVNTTAPPIIRLTNKILADAIKLDASDIHLEPNRNNLAVRFRIDGVLQNIISIPKRIQNNVIARLKVLANMDITERRRPQDGRVRVGIAGVEVDMRVSSIPAASGEKLVLRLLKADYDNLNLGKLHIPDHILTKLYDLLHKRGKLLLVTGPTGSGKTTTLYSALNFLKDSRSNITTIEDPIEYKFEHLNQIQVNQAANVTFASVLRAVLRQDPDIVMVGEIRDAETARIVLQAAQTGHLVLSTVHTNDAPAAIGRLIELGADRYSIASAVRGILAQRLVRLICPMCKVRADDEYLQQFEMYVSRYNVKTEEVHVGKGCQACFYSGYKGRQGIYSYFDITEPVAEAIYSGGSYEKLVAKGRRDGFIPLDESAIRILESGQTSFEEIRPYLNISEESSEENEKSAGVQMPVQEVRIKLDTGTGQASLPGVERAGRPRVLIVDDNRSVRRMLATLLKREMVEVSEAENGAVALAQIVDEPPQLILCDVQMPEMSGWELLQKLKSGQRTRDIPVIMLTVDDSESNESKLLEMGAREFLSKRSSPLVLVSRIRRVLSSL